MRQHLEIGTDGDLYFADTDNGLRRPLGIAFDPDGNFYVLDMLNSRIAKVAQ